MTQPQKRALPSYRDPPVVEVLLGVTFKPVPEMSVAHVGRWWEQLGDNYEVRDVAPLSVVVEGFGGASTRQVELLEVPPTPRVWFSHKNGAELVQLQRDRFVCNWRKADDDTEYPRFDAVSGTFYERLASFQKFMRGVSDAPLEFVQFELTYVNHIHPDTHWKEFADIGEVFPDLKWRREPRFLPSPETIDSNAAFRLPDETGRLHVRIRTAARRNDQQPLFVLESMARGVSDDIEHWFSVAHEWIVRGFADLTSEAVQKDTWRIK